MREDNVEGEGRITLRDLVRAALRMRPDRIILGESRGAEAYDVLQALNSGHEGGMTSVHANTAREALTKLVTMAAQAPERLGIPVLARMVAQSRSTWSATWPRTRSPAGGGWRRWPRWPARRATSC